MPDYYKGKTGLDVFGVVDEFGLDFYEGNIVKYVVRWRKKGGLEDLRKARAYVEALIARAEDWSDDDVVIPLRVPVTAAAHTPGTPCARPGCGHPRANHGVPPSRACEWLNVYAFGDPRSGQRCRCPMYCAEWSEQHAWLPATAAPDEAEERGRAQYMRTVDSDPFAAQRARLAARYGPWSVSVQHAEQNQDDDDDQRDQRVVQDSASHDGNLPAGRKVCLAWCAGCDQARGEPHLPACPVISGALLTLDELSHDAEQRYDALSRPVIDDD